MSIIRCLPFAILSLCAALAGGCSAGDNPPPPILGSGEPTATAAPSTPEVCGNHEEGCPCDEPGATTDCGRIRRVAGDYVWCSTGTQTCDQYGSWGKCTGDQIAQAK